MARVNPRRAGYAPGPLLRAYLVPARQAPRPASSPRGGAHPFWGAVGASFVSRSMTIEGGP